MRKNGRHTVGVQRRWYGSAGKIKSCVGRAWQSIHRQLHVSHISDFFVNRMPQKLVAQESAPRAGQAAEPDQNTFVMHGTAAVDEATNSGSAAKSAFKKPSAISLRLTLILVRESVLARTFAGVLPREPLEMVESRIAVRSRVWTRSESRPSTPFTAPRWCSAITAIATLRPRPATRKRRDGNCQRPASIASGPVWMATQRWCC